MIGGAKVGRCCHSTWRSKKQGPSGELFPSPNGPRPPGEGVVGLRSPGTEKITEGRYSTVTVPPVLAPPQALSPPPAVQGPGKARNPVFFQQPSAPILGMPGQPGYGDKWTS